ncbi:MAG TPA: hypothetical protein VGG41_18605 [Solirubrobacteraceae bacterium]
MTVTTPAHEPTASFDAASTPGGVPRRLAVFGSVSAEGPSRALVEPPDSAAREVLERVFAEIAAQAPVIAAPVLERAVAAASITSDERDELIRALAAPPEEADPDAEFAPPQRSVAASNALREALSAVRRASPAIAEPILDAAVTEGLLTAAQEQRIVGRLSSSPAAIFRPNRVRD